MRTIGFFKKLFEKKEQKEVDVWLKERTIAKEKLEELKSCIENGHKVIIGIRPERIEIEKVEKGKKYDNW